MPSVRGWRQGRPPRVRGGGSWGPAADGAVAVQGHGLGVERLGADVRADGRVFNSAVGQCGPQVGVGAVGGAGYHDRRPHAQPAQRVERVQGQPPLLAVRDLGVGRG